MCRKTREEEKQRLKLGMVPVGVVIQYDCANDPDGHLHTCMQRYFHCLPFSLPLRKSRSSPSKADKFLQLKAECLEREELCNHHNSLLQSGYWLCRTKVPSYSACPLCQTKDSSCGALKMHGTMVAPRSVYKMCGTKVSCCTEAVRDLHTCLSAEIFLQRKVSRLKSFSTDTSHRADLRSASLSDSSSLNSAGFKMN